MIDLINRITGMIATLASVEEELEELEQHFHNVSRAWGALAGADETNAIEANVNRPFVAVSGNNTWGAAVPILGTDDNPVLAGQTEFDFHQVLVTDLDDITTPWRLRIIWGTGTSADAITAEQWTEEIVQSNAVPGNRAGASPVIIPMPQVAIGWKLWAQAWNATNAEELSFFYQAHGYPYPPP